MSEKEENKAKKLRKRNKKELKQLFEQNTCIDCGGTIENEPNLYLNSPQHLKCSL